MLTTEKIVALNFLKFICHGPGKFRCRDGTEDPTCAGMLVSAVGLCPCAIPVITIPAFLYLAPYSQSLFSFPRILGIFLLGGQYFILGPAKQLL